MSHQAQSPRGGQSGPLDELDIVPIKSQAAKREGGSLRITIPADAAKRLGIEPAELEHNESVPFLVSLSKKYDGRIVLDHEGQA